MSNDKYEKLVQILHLRTRSGLVPWKQSSEDDVFQVSFKANSVRISKVEKIAGTPDYLIYLVGPTGEIADSFSDVELDRPHQDFGGDPQYYAMMGELYTMARRSALGADKIINSILNELDDEFI